MTWPHEQVRSLHINYRCTTPLSWWKPENLSPLLKILERCAGFSSHFQTLGGDVGARLSAQRPGGYYPASVLPFFEVIDICILLYGCDYSCSETTCCCRRLHVLSGAQVTPDDTPRPFECEARGAPFPHNFVVRCSSREISHVWSYTLNLARLPRYPIKKKICRWRRVGPGTLSSLDSAHGVYFKTGPHF